MFTLELLFLESRENEFKGKKYMLSTFIDTQSLTIIYGVDINLKLVEGTKYKCVVNLRGNKFRVVDVKTT